MPISRRLGLGGLLGAAVSPAVPALPSPAASLTGGAVLAKSRTGNDDFDGYGPEPEPKRQQSPEELKLRRDHERTRWRHRQAANRFEHLINLLGGVPLQVATMRSWSPAYKAIASVRIIEQHHRESNKLFRNTEREFNQALQKLLDDSFGNTAKLIGMPFDDDEDDDI